MKKKCNHNFFRIDKMREPFNIPEFEGDKFDGVIVMCAECKERRWLQKSGDLLVWKEKIGHWSKLQTKREETK